MSLPLRAHTPLIHFLGKRMWPAALAPAHPHPAAPPEYRKTFSDSLQLAPNDHPSFRDYWDAPARFWQPKHHELQDVEIDAVQSGGASLLSR